MKPIKFNEQTKILQKPSKLTDEECSSLPVFCDDLFCISLWRGNLKERIKFLFTGRMWFSTMSGKTHYPIKLMVDYPFNKN